LFVVLKFSYTWMDNSFTRFWEFYPIYLLDMFPMPLACISSSSVTVIHRFGLLMESQSSCMFCLYLFILFSISLSYFPIIVSLSSNPDILSFPLFCLLGIAFNWIIMSFSFQSFNFIFSVFLYLCWICHLCLAFSSLFLSAVYFCPFKFLQISVSSLNSFGCLLVFSLSSFNCLLLFSKI
jgi:hypothetical protein